MKLLGWLLRRHLLERLGWAAWALRAWLHRLLHGLLIHLLLMHYGRGLQWWRHHHWHLHGGSTLFARGRPSGKLWLDVIALTTRATLESDHLLLP
ncbi:MAG: hypothetical protein L6Q71_11865 [Planctomycetes bacterium]|nr:hypothetical protein [Planctomycetota bacterium]NUQ33396.1 hypothetical protein [Planctomycetaceae bacterium]